MKVRKITDEIFQLSVNVENLLFEGLWDIPNGVSLNSYIVKGEKTAIIDGVCGWDGVPETLFALLDELEIDPKSVDYLVVNHMEPDHSGWIEDFKKISSDFKVVASKKSLALIDAFYGGFDQELICVGDGDEIDLGNGHVLSFIDIPNVHWPDTIATFDKKANVLFPCDAFGSYGSIHENSFDDELSQEEVDFYEYEAQRYYANIVAAFSLPVQRAIDKCKTLPIEVIAPGHGIVWRENPQKIIDDYTRYAQYQKGPAKAEVTLIYGSMYGMTEKSIQPMIEAIKSEGLDIKVRRVPEDSWGVILGDVWSSQGIILAMPTYEYKMFPPMAAVLEEIGNKKVFNRLLLHVGSYGWSGGAKKELDYILEHKKMNWEIFDSIEYKGSPSDEDLKHIVSQSKAFAREVVNQVEKDA